MFRSSIGPALYKRDARCWKQSEQCQYNNSKMRFFGPTSAGWLLLALLSLMEVDQGSAQCLPPTRSSPVIGSPTNSTSTNILPGTIDIPSECLIKLCSIGIDIVEELCSYPVPLKMFAIPNVCSNTESFNSRDCVCTYINFIKEYCYEIIS